VNDDRPDPTDSDSDKAEYRQYLRLSTLGIEMGVALAIGMLIGWYLDRLFGTRPWLIITFSIFGIAAGFRNLVRLARKDWDDEGPSSPASKPR
jgi:ATP synthase protein I